MAKFAIEQDQPVAAFSRASVAYDEGEQVAIDTPRTKQTVVLSASDGSFDGVGLGVSDRSVVVWTAVNGVLYGLDSSQLVYTSDDGGDTWVQDETAPRVTSLFATPNGNLIGARYNETPDNQDKVQRCNLSTGAWSEITLPDAFSQKAQLFGWSFKIGGSIGQTILMTEYSSTGYQAGVGPSTRRIFRSTDDGLTWTKCFDGGTFWADEIAGTSTHVPSHIHSVHYHAGTGRWFSFWGDGARQRILYSADDGVTWAEFYTPGDVGIQPISFYDYGDATKLLCGSDDAKPMYLMDCLTGQVETAWDNTYNVSTATFVFAIGKYAGVYYAVLSESTAATGTRAILVSRDAVNWYVYHQFNAAETAANRGPFFAAGKLHWSINDGGHFRMSPAKLQAVEGTTISPATQNVLTEASSVGSSGWSSGSGVTVTVTHEATGGYAGANCVKATGTAANPYWRDTAKNLTRGQKYIYAGMIKGRRTIVRPIMGSPSAPLGGQPVIPHRADDTWSPFKSYVYAVPEGEGATAENRLWMLATQRSILGTIENFLTFTDAVQCIPLPIKPWAIGQASISPDVLTETVTPGKLWTDIFAFETLAAREYYDATATLTIKTWAVDADNKIDILYDPTDAKFKLRRTIDGTPEDTADSAAQYWHGNACVKFILRVSGAACSLTIQNGRAAETLDDDGMPDLLDAEIVGTYGDFPMVVLTGWNRSQFVPLWIADTDVVKVMALTTPDYTKVGTAAAPDVFPGRGVF